jgi:hypothetical protein
MPNEYEADGTLGDLYIVQHRPDEHRFRLGLKHRWPSQKNCFWNRTPAMSGFKNKNFISGNSGNDILLGASLKYNFDKYFKYSSRGRSAVNSEQQTLSEN